MPVRRPWVLLVLAAVFSMHGLQCLSGAPGSDHGAAPVVTTSPPVGGITTVTSAGVVAAVASPGTAAHAVLGVASASGSATLPAPGLPVHDTPLWAACLAVVLTGMTVLGAVALLRWAAVPSVRGSPAIPRWTTGWSRPPRRPDLAALCLLRI